MGEDDRPGTLVTHQGERENAFRILKVGVPSEDDWRSHYELGREPRKSEVGSALEHMGLSMWTTEEQARAVAERFPKLGTFIGEVELNGDRGVWYSQHGTEGHVLVWGRRRGVSRLASIASHPFEGYPSKGTLPREGTRHMTYGIFNLESGTALAWYDSFEAAFDAVRRIASAEPSSIEELGLMEFDDHGMPGMRWQGEEILNAAQGAAIA